MDSFLTLVHKNVATGLALTHRNFFVILQEASLLNENGSGLHGRRWPSADLPTVHVDNRPKFGLISSISWTNSDAGPRLSFKGGRADEFLIMDGIGRRTMIIYGGRTDGMSISWTETDDGPWLLSIDGRRWTAGRIRAVYLTDEFHDYLSKIDGGGRRQTIHLMNEFRRRTFKYIKMWTEVDRWMKVRP